MTLHHTYARLFATTLLLGWILSLPTGAQTPPAQKPAAEQAEAQAAACSNLTGDTFRTLYLHHMTQINEANEVFTAIRQLLPPHAKSIFVPSQMAIEICGTPENIASAERIVKDLDRPKKAYRVSYTVTEMDGAKRLSSQHFSLIVAPGQNSTLKQGSRVPIVTGSFNDKSATQQNAISYVDVGMNFDAALDETAEGIRLRTSAEQSSIAEERSGVGPQDPVVRQASFKGTSFLTPGKPLKLGTFDYPDSTRHLELEVTMEPLP